MMAPSRTITMIVGIDRPALVVPLLLVGGCVRIWTSCPIVGIVGVAPRLRFGAPLAPPPVSARRGHGIGAPA